MAEGEKTFTADNSGRIAFSPPTHLILHDETGQTWAISVRPDGQLQTARWPDGEPVRFVREISTAKLIEIVRNETVDMLESVFAPPSRESLQWSVDFYRKVIGSPESSPAVLRIAEREIKRLEREIAQAARDQAREAHDQSTPESSA